MMQAVRLALLGLAAAAAGSQPASGETAYFVVSELPGDVTHGDSYVLLLADPEAIAHARALIENPHGTLPTIVVATIAPGSDGVNRDVLAKGQPLWPWHITGFMQFTNVTAEIYDGWPTLVGDDVPGWIDNTDGVIGFWRYTVTAELVPGGSADFNVDGNVDAADFLIWQRHAGGAGGRGQGDANGDGLVDGDDLTAWRAEFGGTPSAITAPEPATSGLATSTLIGLLLTRVQSAMASCGSGCRRRGRGRWRWPAPRR